MALPTVKYPTYTTRLPSTGEEVKYRPFMVEEEKVLIMAVNSENAPDTINEVLTACMFGKVKVSELPSFDIEYLFLRIRAVSVSESMELEYRNANCPQENGNPCKKTFKVSIKIDDVKVQTYDPKQSEYVNLDSSDMTSFGKKIMLDDNLGVTIRYPRIQELAEAMNSSDVEIERENAIIVKCITSVFDHEDVHTNFEEGEIAQWFTKLTTLHKEPMRDFVRNIPVMRYQYHYVCKQCGFEEDITLEGLQSFL